MKKADPSLVEWGSDVHAPFQDKAALREIATIQKFDKSQGLLLEFMPDERIEWLPNEAETLRKIVGKLR